MKHASRLGGLLIIASGTLAGLVIACSSSSKDSPADAGSGPTPTTPDGSTSTDGSTSADGSTSTDGSTTPDGGPTGTTITSCTTATLWAGNPTYVAADPSVRPTDGTGILADPPFQWGSLSFIGNRLYTRDTGEIWYVDTSVAAPVEKKLLGSNQGADVSLKFGACSTALVGAIQGIVALKDGSLVAPDAYANDVIHIKNPTDPATCAIESWAGTKDDVTFSGMDYPNLGDVDGVLGTSKIGYPTAIATDGNDVVYFYDGQARKFKTIANDAVHTVTTIGAMPDGLDICYGMTSIGATIYALGYGSSGATNIYKIVGTTITKVTGGDGSFWNVTGSAQLGGIATDGTNLVVAGKGYMWLVKVADGSKAVIAGSGEIVDLETASYDPKASHPALEVTLKPQASASFASVGSPDYLGFKDGNVYYRGHGDSTAAYVEKIQCR